MPRRCERPGCSQPADVAYGFDANQSSVWLEAVTLEEAERVNAGVLCRRHADALRPPRGWFLDDRREARPRLFPAPAVEGPVRPRSRRERSNRAQDNTDELPFPTATGTEAGPDGAENAIPAGDPVVVAAGAAPVHTDHVDHVDRVDRARADDQAGDGDPGDQQPSDDAGDHRPGEHDPAGDPGDDLDETEALPWTPVFDQTDDLGGLLDARSPLLSRAFGRRTGSGAPAAGAR